MSAWSQLQGLRLTGRMQHVLYWVSLKNLSRLQRAKRGKNESLGKRSIRRKKTKGNILIIPVRIREKSISIKRQGGDIRRALRGLEVGIGNIKKIIGTKFIF